MIQKFSNFVVLSRKSPVLDSTVSHLDDHQRGNVDRVLSGTGRPADLDYTILSRLPTSRYVQYYVVLWR